MSPLLFVWNIGLPETLVILVVGLLIFGSRLPEVGRSMGRGLMEFKKGLRGFQDEMQGVEREADRAIDDELARRRSQASAHDLAEDPRTPGQEAIERLQRLEEDPSDPQPDADRADTDPSDDGPQEEDFVPGDPARDEVLGPRTPFGSSAPDSEEFQSPDVPPRRPEAAPETAPPPASTEPPPGKPREKGGPEDSPER